MYASRSLIPRSAVSDGGSEGNFSNEPRRLLTRAARPRASSGATCWAPEAVKSGKERTNTGHPGHRETGFIVTNLRAGPALLAALAVLTCGFARAAGAAVPVHVVKTDLKPLIRAGYQTPVQFAVLVPHTASVGTAGAWSVSGDRASWTYAVRVPTAVSMSFHATQVSLPASAAIIVRSAKTTTSYRARDVHRGELWSRIQPGDALQITLTVAAADRGKTALKIVSLQAGYRSLGAGVEDHPYYRRLKAVDAAATGNAGCVTNYSCQVTAANTPPGAATVVLVIGNLYLCTGTLVNDVPQDTTPYVLTARHCENGQLGGGDPGAASTISVYWDATTACGSALGSIYDSNFPKQTGRADRSRAAGRVARATGREPRCHRRAVRGLRRFRRCGAGWLHDPPRRGLRQAVHRVVRAGIRHPAERSARNHIRVELLGDGQSTR
jgi:hypothetical protein